MNTNLTDFSGNYSRQGKYFINSLTNKELMICQRSAKNLHKQPYFILQKLPDNSRRYVSSLYPTNGMDAEYYFDYDGIKYRLNLTENGIKIEEAKTPKITEYYQCDFSAQIVQGNPPKNEPQNTTANGDISDNLAGLFSDTEGMSISEVEKLKGREGIKKMEEGKNGID